MENKKQTTYWKWYKKAKAMITNIISNRIIVNEEITVVIIELIRIWLE